MNLTVGCPNDQNPVTPGRWLCPACETDYLDRLRSLNGQLAALRSVALKQARIGTPEHRPSTGFPPSPIDWQAQQLVDETAEWMRVRLALIDATCANAPLRRWRMMWTKLVANRRTLLTLDTAPYDYHALRRLSERIERRLTPQPDRLMCGHCPACGAPVLAPRKARRQECRECGTMLDLAQVRVAWLDQAAATELGEAAATGMHITRTQAGAAEWLMDMLPGRRFTANQVKGWRRRGKLPSCRRVGRPSEHCWEWSIRELLACAGDE